MTDQQGAPATWLTDPAPTPEREFAEWLNERRGFSVSAVFHEIMRKFAARAPADSVTAPAGGGVVGWLPVHFNGHGFYGGPLKTEAEANQYIAQVHQSNDSVTLIARPFAWATATSTTSVRAEALRLAEALDLYAAGDEHQRDIEDAAAELRRLHATPPAQAADSVQDLQPVHDAVTIDLLNERVAYLERKLKEADSVLEDAARLAKIIQAIRDYHFALDNREHGGVAMERAWNAICDVLNMDWVQGAESAARKQGGAT